MASKVLVLASTGTVGSGVVQQLVQAGESVRAATRNPEKHTPAPGVEPVRFSFGDATTFGPALEGVGRVFLLVPAGELAPYDLVFPFLEAVLEDKSRKIVIMTAEGVEFDDENPYRKLELLIEKSGNPFVILRPNWFMDNFHTYWLPGILQAGVIAVPAADAKTAFIDARDISASVVAALQTDQFDGQAFTLTGPESLTYTEAAEILSRKAGRDIHYVAVKDEAFVKTLVEANVPEAYARFLTHIFGAVRQGFMAQPTADVETLTGRAPYTLAQYAQDHAAVWQNGE